MCQKLAAIIINVVTLITSMPALATATAPPKNIIMMISDGYGPAGVTLTRYIKGSALNLDAIQTGSIQTYSSDSLITDSAASATAYATGHKTYNGAVSVDIYHQPLKTVLEAFQSIGKSTGLVVTTEITDATPAAYSAHVQNRSEQEEIARQQMAHHIDVFFGGGRQRFLPEELGGTRKDGLNLLQQASESGISVISKRDQLATATMPVVGLFASGKLPYELDRKDDIPSLYNMSAKALELLSHSNNGFFLMIEGSRIDHAGHNNDIAALAKEAQMYDRTIGLAMDFVKQHPDTLLISTSDHETGGLTVSRDKKSKFLKGKGSWYPEVIRKMPYSKEAIVNRLAAGKSLKKMLAKLPFELSNKDEDKVKSADKSGDYERVAEYLGRYVDEISRTGWTTHGHTAVDVNLYAFGRDHEAFQGNMDNTEIGLHLLKYAS